jgi:hypothetical protein
MLLPNLRLQPVVVGQAGVHWKPRHPGKIVGSLNQGRFSQNNLQTSLDNFMAGVLYLSKFI